MTDSPSTRTAGSSRRHPPARVAALIAAILVPLAVAGLFVGAFSRSDDGLDRIPAAVVNSDELVNQTQPDGTETPVFAGRQLVTELTGPDNQGFDWTITNADDARAALESGEVYAVLTVPADFSTSILSLQSATPTQAEISVRTDDAHSYLTPAVVAQVGDSMVRTFGRGITEQYLTALYASFGGVGSSLSDAADGAAQLGTGATSLGDGIGQLATGTTASQTGAQQLASGLTTYTNGVGSLSSGLGRLNTGAAGLTQVSTNVTAYTGGVSQLSAALTQASAGLASTDPVVQSTSVATVQAIAGQLSTAAAGGSQLASGTSTAISGIQTGIAQSATGASRLASGSGALTSGADALASGLGDLAAGATTAQTGATELAAGAATLSDGLRTGADQVPSMDDDSAADTAAVVAEPVTLSVDRTNEVSDAGQAIATFFVPLGLWLGAIATFLVLVPLPGRVLASSASTGRLVRSTVVRAGAVAVTQAVLLVALLHLVLGIRWELLPATLGLSLVTALAFTAFHHLLATVFGRAGTVISLLLLVVQLTSTGGVYPVQLLAAPFQAISPLLPLTYGVSGMQAIIAGGAWADAAAAALALLGFGVVSVLLASLATRRLRSARRLGLLVAPA